MRRTKDALCPYKGTLQVYKKNNNSSSYKNTKQCFYLQSIWNWPHKNKTITCSLLSVSSVWEPQRTCWKWILPFVLFSTIGTWTNSEFTDLDASALCLSHLSLLSQMLPLLWIRFPPTPLVVLHAHLCRRVRSLHLPCSTPLSWFETQQMVIFFRESWNCNFYFHIFFLTYTDC